MQHIHIHPGNYPDAGAYCRQWRKVIEMARLAPNAKFLRRRPFAYETAREYREEYLRAVHSRINSRGGQDAPRGRKDDIEYFYAAARDARRIRDKKTRRTRFYCLETSEARKRFGHLIDSYEE
jgi:hypothetical protein